VKFGDEAPGFLFIRKQDQGGALYMSFAGLGADVPQRKVLFRINPNKNNISFFTKAT
jgi:hypothetical protein